MSKGKGGRGGEGGASLGPYNVCLPLLHFMFRKKLLRTTNDMNLHVNLNKKIINKITIYNLLHMYSLFHPSVCLSNKAFLASSTIENVVFHDLYSSCRVVDSFPCSSAFALFFRQVVLRTTISQLFWFWLFNSLITVWLDLALHMDDLFLF